MKCVCPMGGDRPCPDDCRQRLWHALSSSERTKQCKAYAEEYAKLGYTQNQIAIMMNVSQKTISKYLDGIYTLGINQKPAKTATNPKGAGRPKGSKQRRINTTAEAEAAAREIVDGVKTYPQAEQDTGYSNVVLRSAVAREEGRREAEPTITPEMLAMTAQQKLDAAVRQHKRKLDAEFEARCREDCMRWLNDVGLPQYLKEIKQIEQTIRDRKGIMDSITYKKIRACLHPDRVQDPALRKRFQEAFQLFEVLEKRLLDEKQSPTTFKPMPRTYEELMAMKARVQAARKARRSAGGNSMRRT